MAFDEQLLALLRCPVSGSELQLADHNLFAAATAASEAGRLVTEAGEPIAAGFEAALIDERRERLYPIYHDIPRLTPAAAALLCNLDSSGDGD